MRTLRYNASTVDNGGVFETAVVDLFSGNLTTRRVENRLLLGRYARGPLSQLSIMSACNVVVIEGWSDASPEQVQQIAALTSMGIKVYVVASDVAEAITFAGQVEAYGVFCDTITAQNKIDIAAAGLKWGSDVSETGTGCGLSTFDPTSLDDASALSAIEAMGANYASVGQVYFYYNTDPNHLPSEEDEAEAPSENIVIPFGTVISTSDGTKLFVTKEATLLAGTKSVEVDFMPLDSFDTIEMYGISQHSLSVENLYVSNIASFDHIDLVCLEDGHLSYVMGLASYSSLFNVDCSTEDSFFASEPPIFMGLDVNEIDFSDTITVSTDTGTAFFDSAGVVPMSFRNELVSIMEHDAGGDSAISYRTSDDSSDIDTFEYLPYANNADLKRYVQFSMEAAGNTWIEVTLTDDGDTIDFIETDRMVDQLPLWMAWREKGSTGYSMTNIVGRYANELFGAAGILSNYHLTDLDDRLNGVALVLSVSVGYVPKIGDVSIVDGNSLPLAADSDELIKSRVPSFYVENGKLYIVRSDGFNIQFSDDIGIEGLEEGLYVNLWTAFDEWGLVLNLSRHTGESLSRFRDRLLDVFTSGFGSNKSGAQAAAERELSPEGMDTGAFLPVGKVSVFDLTNSSMTAPDGFPTEAKTQAVQEQRNAGVHTWDNAKAGSSIFDADGTNHEGQGRMPYIYDTPLDDVELLSGVGPGDDLLVQRAGNVLLSPTVGIRVEGSDFANSYTGRRLQATVLFGATGTYKTITKPEVRYKVRAQVTTSEGGQTKNYYRDFIGYQQSNVNPNATSTQIGYKNTNVTRIDLVHRDRSGAIMLPGTWFDSAGGSKPIHMSSDATITSISITNPDSNASVAYWLQYTTDAHVISSSTPTSSTLTKSDVSSNSSVLLNIIVAPFDASSTTNRTWNSEKIPVTVMLNNTLENGVLANNSVVVNRPAFYVPSYVTGLDYTATVLSVVPVDNPDRLVDGETDEGKISQAVLDDLKLGVTGAAGTVWNDTNNAHTQFKRYFTVAFDSSKVPQASSFPYVRKQLAGIDASSSIIVPKLSDGETRVINLQPGQIPSLPVTATGSTTRVTTNYPNISARLSGDTLIVSRFDGKWYNNLYAGRGYYWISGLEKYAYSYTDGSNVGPLAEAFEISSPTTTVTMSKRPANFSMTRVLVDGEEYSYRFYGDYNESDEYIKTFESEGMPTFTNSFYIDGITVHLSETIEAGSTVTVISEPVESSGVIDTGVSVAPYASWDDRFFVVIDDSDVVVNSIEIESDVQTISSDRAAGGCLDITLVSARALDSDGNPVEGVTMAWEASAGNVHVAQAVTGADGRSVAYYTPVGAGEMTITASTEGKSVTTTVVSTAASGSTRPLIVTAGYPSMIMSGMDFLADIEIVSSDPISSVEYSLFFIAADGTQNVGGSWTDITPASHVLAVTDGKTRYSKSFVTEGLYKMVIDKASLVWRVY